MLNDKLKILCKKAFLLLGYNNQIYIAIEEMSEATKELTKYLRGKGRKEKLCEELAHAKFMIEQMTILYDVEYEVEEEYKKAIDRLISLFAEKVSPSKTELETELEYIELSKLFYRN